MLRALALTLHLADDENNYNWTKLLIRMLIINIMGDTFR